MRRLTLILSDLYLPANARRESFPTTLAMPALEALLRVADRATISSWRHWLTRDLGTAVFADWPVAQIRARALGLPPEGVWMATPVALEARLDHVRLRDRGLLRLPAEQQQSLQVEFERVFGAQIALHVPGSPSLLLRGGPKADIDTHDPARLLDSDIGHALPGGSTAAGELRRLGAEIEMWLHSSPVNTLREKTGQRRISSLWLWGGGAPRTSPAAAAGSLSCRLLGEDDHLHALAALGGRESLAPAPDDFAALDADGQFQVELAPMSGSAPQSLSELERRWFAPARDALATGALDELRIVANDRVFITSSRARWRFWRPRRNWLESLA